MSQTFSFQVLKNVKQETLQTSQNELSHQYYTKYILTQNTWLEATQRIVE